MKRIFGLAAAIAIAIPGPILVSAPAMAQGASGVVNFCKGDVPNNPPFVLGDCVGFVANFVNDTEGLTRFICDYLSIAEPELFDVVYVDVPECIRDRASQLPPPPY